MARRVLVCGDRNWTDFQEIFDKLYALIALAKDCQLVVIEGEASGADLLARKAALVLGLPVVRFPDLVLAFHPDLKNSKGTKDMVERAEKAGIEVRIYAT
jgi:hypothetical protein